MPGQKYPPVAVILGSRESQAPAYGLENSAAVRALQNLTEVLIVRVAEGQDPLADRLVGRVASLLGREYTTTHTLFSSAKTSLRARSQVADLQGVAALISLAPPTETIMISGKIPVIQVADSSFGTRLRAEKRRGGGISRLVSVQGRILEKASASGVSLFAVANRWIKDVLIDDLNIPSSKVEVVPMGSFVGESKIIRPTRITDRDVLKLLFVSEDWKRDGGPMILDLYERLVKVRKVQLCIVGDSPEDLLYEIRRVPAPSSYDEAAKVYIEHDVLLVPVAAGKDALVTDALYCGLPVLGERVEGIASLVRHDRSGWLYRTDMFQQNSYKRLQFMKAVDIDNASLWAVRDVRERLNWDSWARRLLQLVRYLNGQGER